ncbi:Protein of unknown function, partial [Gryllus bimaculatus]
MGNWSREGIGMEEKWEMRGQTVHEFGVRVWILIDCVQRAEGPAIREAHQALLNSRTPTDITRLSSTYRCNRLRRSGVRGGEGRGGREGPWPWPPLWGSGAAAASDREESISLSARRARDFEPWRPGRTAHSGARRPRRAAGKVRAERLKLLNKRRNWASPLARLRERLRWSAQARCVCSRAAAAGECVRAGSGAVEQAGNACDVTRPVVDPGRAARRAAPPAPRRNTHTTRKTTLQVTGTTRFLIDGFDFELYLHRIPSFGEDSRCGGAAHSPARGAWTALTSKSLGNQRKPPRQTEGNTIQQEVSNHCGGGVPLRLVRAAAARARAARGAGRSGAGRAERSGRSGERPQAHTARQQPRRHRTAHNLTPRRIFTSPTRSQCVRIVSPEDAVTHNQLVRKKLLTVRARAREN